MSKTKILLVDDERDLVETMEMALEAKGYEVICAYDGDEGLKQAVATHPDIIILDLKRITPAGPIEKVETAPSLNPDGTANTNWQNYRYKVFQTIVPIRNITVKGAQTGC